MTKAVQRCNWTHTGMVAYGEADLLRQRCWVLSSDYDRDVNASRAQVKALRAALERIAAIEDELYSGDWDEIEQARDIANAALQAHQ